MESQKVKPLNKPRESNGLFSLLMVLICACLLLITCAVEDEIGDDAAKRHRIEVMYQNYQKDFPDVTDISADQAVKSESPGSPLFVDVRKHAEQSVSMLPGAITEKEFLIQPEAYKDRLVIAYCTIGYRSGKFAQKVRKQGIDVLNLRGGILAWLHIGGKVFNQGKIVNHVHVYGKKWDLAPSTYKTVR